MCYNFNMKTFQIIQTESEIQNAIMQYLALKNIFHWRNNSGCLMTEYKGRKRPVRYGKVGSPDIICVYKGKFVGIEVKGQDKTGKWGEQSEVQQHFQTLIENNGGIYVLAKSIDDVIKVL